MQFIFSFFFQPLRAMVMGPPAVGKSTVVKQLCDHYKLHHIQLKDLIEEALENLQKSAARVDSGEEEAEGEEGKAQVWDIFNEMWRNSINWIGCIYVSFDVGHHHVLTMH